MVTHHFYMRVAVQCVRLAVTADSQSAGAQFGAAVGGPGRIEQAGGVFKQE